MVVGGTDDVVTETEGAGVDCLGVALEHVHRVDGRGSEVAESKGRIHGGGDEELLCRVGTHVSQLLIVSCKINRQEIFSIHWMLQSIPYTMQNVSETSRIERLFSL